MTLHQQTSIRYTFDMSIDMSHYLKHAAIDDRVHVSTIVKQAIENWIAAREEAIDEKNYLEGKKDLDSGNVVDFDAAMAELGL